MKAKRISAIILAVILILSLAACGGQDDSGEDTGKPASVYWLNFKPELDETLQSLAAKYKESKGVDVKIVTPASGEYSNTLASEMETSSPPTLFVIGNDEEVGKWADSALDLTDTAIAKELNTDAYELKDDSGKLVSVGYCYESAGIAVNRDLIEFAGWSLDEIKDFEGLKAAAEDIHSRALWLGFDAFAAPDMDEDNSWRFTAHAANLEYFYEERDAGGWTECPSSLSGKYMYLYKNLYDLAINNSTTAPEELAAGGHDPKKEFINGKAAFFFTGSWDYADISAAQPNVTMIPYYSGIEGEDKAGLSCGTENCWAVNSTVSKADQDATIDFMVWLVSDKEASAAMVKQLGIMPYKNAAKSDNGFLNDAVSYTDKGYYQMDWAFNFQPNREVYRAELVAALNRYTADQSDANWELVKTAFVDGWAKQYAAADN